MLEVWAFLAKEPRVQINELTLFSHAFLMQAASLRIVLSVDVSYEERGN